MPNKSKKSTLIAAAERADWMTVVLNQGPPCFHVDERGNFCFRAERWFGHHCDKPDHAFVSLADMLSAALGDPQ
jgi:hypothetical protein